MRKKIWVSCAIILIGLMVLGFSVQAFAKQADKAKQPAKITQNEDVASKETVNESTGTKEEAASPAAGETNAMDKQAQCPMMQGGCKGGGVGAKGLLVVISALAAALGVGIATIGPGLGQGNAVARAMEAIGRNPESQSKIMPTLLIGLAFMESLVLYALLVSLVLLFLNPFIKMV